MYRKIVFLLSKKQKKQIISLFFLLVVGIFFEMLGLGVLVPVFSGMLNPQKLLEYSFLNNNATKALLLLPKTKVVLVFMIILILVYIIKSIFLFFLTWKQNKFSSDLSADLSKRMFEGYLRQPYSFHLLNNSAFLLRNIQTEVNQFLSVSQNVVAISIEISAAVGISFMLFLLEPFGAFLVMAFLIFSVFIFYRLTRNKLQSWGENRQVYDGKTNQHIIQGLNGIKDVIILGRQKKFLENFNKYNLAKAAISTKQYTLQMIPRFYLELLAVIGLSFLILVMTIQGKSNDIIIPIIGVFVAAAFRIIPSFNRIMSSIQTIKYNMVAIDLLYIEFSKFEDLNLNIENHVVDFNNEISINDVVFTYPNNVIPSLLNISIKIKKGSSIGLMGKSGSGKSTIADVLIGLLTPDKGEILIDNNVNIEKALESWRSKIGYVSQNIYLTDNSILENVAFGIPSQEIDVDQVINVLKLAQIFDFISSLPDGLNTIVGERGVRLSGGQKQRIGIARALYNNPELLILDEATSALDNETENDIMNSVYDMKGLVTMVIIAHRLSTIENCDYIYELSNGSVVSSGTPSEILYKNKKN
jgi:ABC-type multidrug transport system fused ATPase/permease subunit